MAYPRYRRDLTGRARSLKKRMTRCEIILWTRLRRKQLGVRFQRQRPVGCFIADFYSKDLQLVIEVDGVTHIGRQEYDEARDRFMESLGITVLRFTDFQVRYDEESVVADIERAISQIGRP